MDGQAQGTPSSDGPLDALPGLSHRPVTRDLGLALASKPALLLVCDLDGTLVGDDDAGTAAFKAWWEGQAAARGSVLVYNTGRSLASAQQLLRAKAHCLPRPDVLVTAVGTRMHTWQGRGDPGEEGVGWQEDEGWTQAMGRGWNLQAVHRGIATANNQVLTSELYYKPDDDQSEHKVTIGLHMRVLDLVLRSVRGALAAQGATAVVVTSHHRDQRVLDILPAAAGKGAAARHVRQRLGFPPSRTVVCGDAGNDILMVADGEHAAIVVGNASQDMLDWLGEGAEDERQERLYMAKGNEAAGVLEGLQHLGFR